MSAPPTNAIILPPETDQPPGLSSEKDDNRSRSNKKVKKTHSMDILLNDDDAFVIVLDETIETLICEGVSLGISQADDTEMNLVAPSVEQTHGMIKKYN